MTRNSLRLNLKGRFITRSSGKVLILLLFAFIISAASVVSAASGDLKKSSKIANVNDSVQIAAADITMFNFGYSPSTLNIAAGKTVLWQNTSVSTHTVTAFDSSYNSGNVAGGQSYSHQYLTPGTYDYYCTIHGQGVMKGKVVVTAPPVRLELEASTTDIVRNGTWATYDSANASNSKLIYSKVKNNYVTVSFVGTAVSLIATKAKLAGKAKVCLDGLSCRTVDFYASSPKWQQVVTSFTGLSNSAHSLSVQVLNTKRSAATNTYVPLDAVDIYQ